jgi:hypothetical protein
MNKLLQFSLDNIGTRYTLELAAQHGQLDLIKSIVSQGKASKVDLNMALESAQAGGYHDIIRYLMDKGAWTMGRLTHY